MILEQGYHTYQGYECFGACVSNYLQWKQVNITASDLFFLGDGFKIYYEKSIERIVSNMYKAGYAFLNNYDMKYSIAQAENRFNAKKILNRHIRNESMIIIKVSAEGLNYNRIYKQAGNSQHYVNIIGLLDEDVYVSDGFVPTRKFSVYQGWICLEDIMEAWEREKYEYIILDEIKSNLDEIEIQESVLIKIMESIKEYTAFSEKNGVIYGYHSIIALLNDLRERVLAHDIYLEERTLFLNQQLRVYGFLSSKKMLLDRIKGYAINADIVCGYDQIIEFWSKNLMKMVKIGFSKDINDFERMYKCMVTYLDDENKLLDKLYEACKNIKSVPSKNGNQ